MLLSRKGIIDNLDKTARGHPSGYPLVILADEASEGRDTCPFIDPNGIGMLECNSEADVCRPPKLQF
jgi:hypothetical protein